MPWLVNQKYAILSNELMRRLSNIGSDVPLDEKLQIIEKFIEEMKNSGYDIRSAREAIISGLKGFKSRWKRRTKDGKNFYRTARETLPLRTHKKLLESTSWYKETEGGETARENGEYSEEAWGWEKVDRKRKSGVKGGKINKKGGKGKIKAVMFVLFTHGSQLAKSMSQSELKL